MQPDKEAGDTMTELNLLGQTIGRFEILSELGRGGMAVVYRARQTDLERIVALKVLPPELSLDQSYIARFRQEARSAAALEHPHIVPIYEVGAAGGLQYIAMKYIAGRTLKDAVQERGALGLQDTATMLEQVADALDYAHSQGVIHRDIKPSNIMVAQNGWVYLTDFGLARGSVTSGLTMAGTVMGTPEYMSPEQAQGLATIGPPTDIYALGVVLYELLTGNMPFQADTPMGMLVARLQYAPRPPREYRGDLPMPVEDVIMRALARKPEARYPSSSALIQALKSAAGLSTRPFATPQPPVSPPQGVPRPPTPQGNQPPISPPFGLSPTQPVGIPQATPPPVSPSQGLPPTRPVGTPPYVIPAVGATTAVPRTATPPPLPVAGIRGASAAPTAGIPAAKSPRTRRGPLIGIGALVLLLALAGGTFMFLRRGPDPRVVQGLQDGQAALEQKGGLDKAIQAYKQVLAADPKNVRANARLALIYNLRGRYSEAEKAARAAIETDPKAPLAQAMLAEALNSQSDYTGALSAANSAIASDEKASIGYGVRAEIEADSAVLQTDKDLLKQAATDADKALELAAQEDNLAKALAHSSRGYVYWQQYALDNDNDAVKRGVEEFNQAIGLQGQIAAFHSDLGYFYDAQGERDHAKEKFESALNADPDYGHLHAGLGWNLYYLNDYQGALNEFNRAIELAPQDIDAYIGKSRVYQDQEKPDYDQAIDALKQAAEVASKSTAIFADLGWAYRNKATAQEYASNDQKGSYGDAEKQFRKALELNGKYYDALTGLGWVLQEQADLLTDNVKYQDAITSLQKSLDIRDDQPYARVALGWSYFGLKQYDQAEEAFQRATELKSNYGYAYYGLGRTLEAEGKRDKARQAYQTAVDNGSTAAKDALARLK
jgi:serine/threonine protein kinase/tetratricopeptide (TPR) repeat protein